MAFKFQQCKPELQIPIILVYRLGYISNGVIFLGSLKEEIKDIA